MSGTESDPETSTAGQLSTTSKIPDGGYGWVCVCCVFLNNAHHWGIAMQSYGVFLSYYLSSSEFPGATPLEYAFIGGLITATALITGPLASAITNRFGMNVTLLCGVAFETAALVGASFCKQTWHLFLSQGVCFGLGLGLQYLSTVGIIPQWFFRHRGLASGIAASGSGTGGLIYSLAVQTMIQKYGVSWSYRILAIVQFIVNLVCGLLIRDRNKDVGTTPTMFQLRLFTQWQYWCFLLWSALNVMGFTSILFSLDDFSRTIGLKAQQGSIITAALNVGQIIGRPGMGKISDLIGPLNMAALMSFITTILCFLMWPFVASYGAVIAFAVLTGIFFGGIWTLGGPVAAEIVALSDLPSCLSMMWLACAGPAAVAEPIALKLRRTGRDGYLDTQMFTASLYMGATICMCLIRIWKAQLYTASRSSDTLTHARMPHTSEKKPNHARRWYG